MVKISKNRASKYHKLFWLSDPLLLSWIAFHLETYGKSICDIGAGNGLLIKYYQNHIEKIFLLEPSIDMINQNSDKLPEYCYFLQGKAENIPLASNSTDICLSKSSLHHFDNMKLGLLEMVRVCKNAFAIVEVIAPDNICIPFLKNVVLKKENGRSSNSIFTENFIVDLSLKYTKGYRALHFDQYIDVYTWLENSDLSKFEQTQLIKYIQSQKGIIKDKMQIHYRNNRLLMLRRMLLFIGLKP